MVRAKEKLGVALNTYSSVQFTDHLAVVCLIMDIPLLFQNSQEHAQALNQYPGLRAEYIDKKCLTPEYLISNYEVLFLSDLLNKNIFHHAFKDLQAKHGKEIRFVICPHGFSDKGYFLKHAVYGDVVLAYGQNMFDQLENEGVLHHMDNYVLTGNYRYTYYKKHKAFYDTLAEHEVFHKFKKKQPVIFYAPTWMDKSYATTFFDCHKEIIGNLPDSYNMIVKPHPALKEKDPISYYDIIGKYSGKANLLFIEDFHLIYPLLANCDIYLGDTSSIGYDMLSFNKPMFFINKNNQDPYANREVYLFRCGTQLRLDDLDNLYSIVETNLPTDQSRFSQVRKEVYTYSFGEERPFELIKKEIIEAYNKPLEVDKKVML